MELKEKYFVPCVEPGGAEKQSAEERKIIYVTVPGSKSITNRALLLATLADGETLLKGTLFSDDSRHFLKCIQDLGFQTQVDEENKCIRVIGHKGRVPKKQASQYVGSAGTAARFLTAYLGISQGTYYMDASEQMRKRPMAPLLEALKELGCEIQYPAEEGREGFFPFTLHSSGFHKNQISVDIDRSSQFLSALLIASVLCEQDFQIDVTGSHGMAYIQMTIQMMKQFGATVKQCSERSFLTRAGQSYNALEYQIEPDVSAACYFYGAAPLLNVPVCVRHVHFESLQGDVEFLKILEKMGCSLEDTAEGIVVYPPKDGVLHGVSADMSACSDQAITLAAVACFAKEPTCITGIGHIRFQESDRIHGIATELNRIGITCEESADSITIIPGKPAPGEIHTYEDHRMAMGFSLIGLRAPGITILDPGCCRKTFENYFETLEQFLSQIR